MTTYGLNENGFTLKEFQKLREDVTNYVRIHGNAGLTMSDDSSLGTATVALLVEVSLLWEVLQALHATRDVDTALDWSLVQMCKLTGTKPNGYSKTIVKGVEVTLNPNKELPAGSVANLSGRPNSRFLSLTGVPPSASGGTFTVDFEAETAGATVVDIGQLNEISVAVSGWTGVHNPVRGETGSQPEENPELREKRERELQAGGSTNLNAIISNVSEVEGVVDVTGYENRSPYWKDGIPPNSYHIIARGGTDADILKSIFDTGTAGIQPFGAIIDTITDSQGEPQAVAYTQGQSLTFYALVTLEKDAELWDANTENEVKDFVSDYVNGLRIGQDVVYEKVRAYCNLPPGVSKLTSLLIGFTSPPTLSTDAEVTGSQYAVCDKANIGITWTP